MFYTKARGFLLLLHLGLDRLGAGGHGVGEKKIRGEGRERGIVPEKIFPVGESY